MHSLARVVSETFGDFFAATNVSIIGIAQVAAQQRQSKTVSTEFVRGELSSAPFSRKS